MKKQFIELLESIAIDRIEGVEVTIDDSKDLLLEEKCVEIDELNKILRESDDFGDIESGDLFFEEATFVMEEMELITLEDAIGYTNNWMEKGTNTMGVNTHIVKHMEAHDSGDDTLMEMIYNRYVRNRVVVDKDYSKLFI